MAVMTILACSWNEWENLRTVNHIQSHCWEKVSGIAQLHVFTSNQDSAVHAWACPKIPGSLLTYLMTGSPKDFLGLKFWPKGIFLGL